MKLGAMNDPRRPIIDEVRWVAEQGFDFIDLTIEAPGAALESTRWSEVHTALVDNGLAVICHAAPYLPIDNPSPLVRQAAVDELRRTVDAAELLGATVCTTEFRRWPNYLSDADGYEFYKQLLQILTQHGAERNVQVALENSSHNSHQLKYFREIFHRIPELKLLLNIGHANVQTATTMTRDYLFALADRLVHVNLSDNNGQEDSHLPFGAPAKGAINLGRELGHLRSFRYDSTITLEINGDRRWLLSCIPLLREAWEAAA
jgi:sugar phosphate isomerase/epimerase